MRCLSVLVALGAAGCDVVGDEDLALSSVSTLYTEARGLELDRDGGSGLLGMNATTCTLDTAYGGTGADYDVSGSTDTVEAGDCGPDGGCDYAVTAGDKITVVQPDDSFWGTVSDSQRFPGLIDVTLVDGGLAVLSDRSGQCLVEFAGRRTLTVRSTVEMPAEACVDAAVERGAGAGAFVASDAGLYAVDEAGHAWVADGADRMSWDAASGLLYAADRDGTRVRALESDGAVLWREDLGGTVVALDDAGDRAGVWVMVDDGEDAGRVVLLDGATGAWNLEEATPGVARQIRSSGDGDTVALIRDQEVLFFSLSAAPTFESDDDAFEISFGDFSL